MSATVLERTAQLEPPDDPAQPAPIRRRFPRPGAEVTIFLAGFVGYVVVGGWLASRGVVRPENLSRIVSAYFPIFGRDPHLAAVGFTWRPIPVLVQMPFTPLLLKWPAMAATGLLGILQSAAFAAGAVVLLRRILSFISVPWWAVPGLVAAFALHPQIVFLAASGSDQPALLFFLLLTASGLGRWIRADSTTALATAGLGLAGAYLSRPESAGAAVATLVVAGWHSWRSTPGPRVARREQLLADLLVLAAPLLTAAVVWSLSSWMITGDLFPFSTAADDLSPQLPGAGPLTGDLLGRGSHIALAALDLMPAVVVLLVAATGAALFQRRGWALSMLAAPLGGWAFAAVVVGSGRGFSYLWTSCLIVPVGVLAAGVLASTTTSAPRQDQEVETAEPDRVLTAIAVIVALVALPTAASALLLRSDYPIESNQLVPALTPVRATAGQRQVLMRPDQDRSLASWLDRQDLADGAVAIDPADGAGVMLSSHRPRQFTSVTDRDFGVRLSSPAAFGVRYLVTRRPAWGTTPDAVAAARPDLTDGMFRLRRVEPNPGDLPAWYVFEIR